MEHGAWGGGQRAESESGERRAEAKGS